MCRHFGHKVEATFDESTGSVTFDGGTASLKATTPELLRITIHAADAAGALRYADVMERHLVKFAFREELVIEWIDPDDASGTIDGGTVSHP